MKYIYLMGKKNKWFPLFLSLLLYLYSFYSLILQKKSFIYRDSEVAILKYTDLLPLIEINGTIAIILVILFFFAEDLKKNNLELLSTYPLTTKQFILSPLLKLFNISIILFALLLLSIEPNLILFFQALIFIFPIYVFIAGITLLSLLIMKEPIYAIIFVSSYISLEFISQGRVTKYAHVFILSNNLNIFPAYDTAEFIFNVIILNRGFYLLTGILFIIFSAYLFEHKKKLLI